MKYFKGLYQRVAYNWENGCGSNVVGVLSFDNPFNLSLREDKHLTCQSLIVERLFQVVLNATLEWIADLFENLVLEFGHFYPLLFLVMVETSQVEQAMHKE